MKEAGIFQQYTDKYDKEMYVQAVKKQLYQKVYDEVRSEVKNDALAQAEEEIERRKEKRKIEEYKKLTWSGLLVAFWAGLLVNQITNIIELSDRLSSSITLA